MNSAGEHVSYDQMLPICEQDLLSTVPAIPGPGASTYCLAVGKTVSVALFHIPSAKETYTIHTSVTSGTSLYQILLDPVIFMRRVGLPRKL